MNTQQSSKQRLTRSEKLDYLIETCSASFVQDCTLLQEMVRWMGENDFDEFFDHLCRNWEIVNPEETEDEESN